jgi:anaerobic selenocysteine-containing dehydrogenase
LRLSPADAASLGCKTGDTLKLSTRRGSASVIAEVTPIMQPGHISLPNGQGIDYRSPEGRTVRAGVAPNELTDVAARDFLAGTPWHKHVPARLELEGERP